MFCSPGSIGKTSCCLMVAASISRGHGHQADATIGSQQRTSAARTRVDRPLHRQPHAAAGQNIGTTDQLQLKINSEPPTTTTLSNLVAANPPFQGATSSPLYLRNKRFKLWGHTRTALSTLFQSNVSYLRRQRKHKKS